MASEPTWKHVFMNWPTGIPRRGVMLTTLNETTPFKSFMIKDDLLLLERTNPDPLGSRFVLLGYDAINSVKLVDPLKESVFTAAGFLGKLSQS
jgi:hypothetical protein